MKHTPGPWTVEDHWTNSLGHVFTLDEQTGDDSITREANARLIAAAPLMLEMLQKIQTLIDTEAYYEYETKVDELLNEAIAKATACEEDTP